MMICSAVLLKLHLTPLLSVKVQQNPIKNLLLVTSQVHATTFSSRVLKHNQWAFLAVYDATPDPNAYRGLLEGWNKAFIDMGHVRLGNFRRL